jgi:hypothetical protein
MHGDRNWRDTIRYMPFLMGMGIGLAVNNTRAVLEALGGHESPFVRTPKLGLVEAEKASGAKKKTYRSRRSLQPFLELSLGLYFVVILFTTIHYRAWLGIPFTLLFLAGFLYIGTTSLLEGRARTA